MIRIVVITNSVITTSCPLETDDFGFPMYMLLLHIMRTILHNVLESQIWIAVIEFYMKK